MENGEQIAQRMELTHEIHRGSMAYYGDDLSYSGVSFLEYLAMHLYGVGYRKIDPDMAVEVKEFAEILYAFQGAMTIENIKASLMSFLLANHYCRMDLDKLKVLRGEDIDLILGNVIYGKYALDPKARRVRVRLLLRTQLSHIKKQIEGGKV